MCPYGDLGARRVLPVRAGWRVHDSRPEPSRLRCYNNQESGGYCRPDGGGDRALDVGGWLRWQGGHSRRSRSVSEGYGRWSRRRCRRGRWHRLQRRPDPRFHGGPDVGDGGRGRWRSRSHGPKGLQGTPDPRFDRSLDVGSRRWSVRWLTGCTRQRHQRREYQEPPRPSHGAIIT